MSENKSFFFLILQLTRGWKDGFVYEKSESWILCFHAIPFGVFFFPPNQLCALLQRLFLLFLVSFFFKMKHLISFFLSTVILNDKLLVLLQCPFFFSCGTNSSLDKPNKSKATNTTPDTNASWAIRRTLIHMHQTGSDRSCVLKLCIERFQTGAVF